MARASTCKSAVQGLPLHCCSIQGAGRGLAWPVWKRIEPESVDLPASTWPMNTVLRCSRGSPSAGTDLTAAAVPPISSNVSAKSSPSAETPPAAGIGAGAGAAVTTTGAAAVGDGSGGLATVGAGAMDRAAVASTKESIVAAGANVGTNSEALVDNLNSFAPTLNPSAA